MTRTYVWTSPEGDRFVIGLDDDGSGYDWVTHEGERVVGDFYHSDMVAVVWSRVSV